MEVVLASASPRRLELLQQVGIASRVRPAVFDEEDGKAGDARRLVLHNALGKCRAVAAAEGDAVPVVAADTIVVIDEAILGKPVNKESAAAMLSQLSGRSHQVMTGVAVRYQGKEKTAVCITKVYFRKLTAAEIAAYVNTGEPLDKAGAYGIQGKGALFGLPLTMLYSMLIELGVKMTE